MSFSRDAYIAASGGIAGEGGTLQENAQALTCLALEMQKLCATLAAPDGSPVVMRIGLHCGPLVGGVVGGNSALLRLSRGRASWIAPRLRPRVITSSPPL